MKNILWQQNQEMKKNNIYIKSRYLIYTNKDDCRDIL